MLGLAEGISDEAKTAVDAMKDAATDIAGVDLSVKPPEFTPEDYDYDSIMADARTVIVDTRRETGTVVSNAQTSEIYRRSTEPEPDNGQDDTGNQPQYIQNDIYIDGRKTARVLTPYVAKELDWEGK